MTGISNGMNDVIRSMHAKYVRETILLLFVLCIATSCYGLIAIYSGIAFETVYFLVLLVLAILLLVRLFSFEYRVKQGYFGNNECETKEIIRFITNSQAK